MQANLSLFKSFVDLVIPLRCIKCGTILGDKKGLCPACWAHVPFITKPFCSCCGLPFEFDIDDEALCGPCSHERPFYTTARSVFAYTEESRDLILKFKHMDALSSAPLFGYWMAQAIQEMKEEVLCIPVPLHWTRLFMRTYNQSALLAREISRLKGWAYSPSLLLRKRRTPSQGFLSRKERVKNVERAFIVSQKGKDYIFGKTIVLVDDVFTTGATVNACSKALLKAGAKSIHVLTLGRVVRGRQVV